MNDFYTYASGASDWLYEQYNWASDVAGQVVTEVSEWLGPVNYSPPRPLLNIARYADEETTIQEQSICLNPFELDLITTVYLSKIYYETEEKIQSLSISLAQRNVISNKDFSYNDRISRSMEEVDLFYKEAFFRREAFLSRAQIKETQLSTEVRESVEGDPFYKKEKGTEYFYFWKQHYSPLSYFPKAVKRAFYFIKERENRKIFAFVKRILCILLPSYVQMLKDFEHLQVLAKRKRVFSYCHRKGFKDGLEARILAREKKKSD